MVTLNLFVTGVCIWVVLLINFRCFQPALKNKQRFKLYRLRDRLSVLAMKGDIDEMSEEYMTLLELINSSIRATSTFKVTDFLRFVAYLEGNKRVKESVLNIRARLEGDGNSEYCGIAGEYFYAMREILYSDTRVLRHALIPIYLFVASLLAILRLTEKPKEKLEHKKMILRQADKWFDEHGRQFSGLCVST